MSTIQSNHSLQFVTPVINSFVDDLLVKILPAGAHSVIEIVQAVIRSAIHDLLQSPPCSVINWVQVRADEGYTDGSMNFNKTFFFVYERHTMCKQFASLHCVFDRNGLFHESCNMYLCIKDTHKKISSRTRN